MSPWTKFQTNRLNLSSLCSLSSLWYTVSTWDAGLPSPVESKSWDEMAAKEKFGSDEQAYSRSFQLHMARTMVTSFQLEIAILEGDSDKAKELVKAMVIERNSGHDLFEN